MLRRQFAVKTQNGKKKLILDERKVSAIEYEECLCGRDVAVRIDGKQVFQVKRAEVKKSSEIHRIRSVFNSEDVGLVRTKVRYKVHLEGIRFRRPFTNFNFADLDNFTLSFEADGKRIVFRGCMWEDYLAAADSKSFSEHITVSALTMKTEDTEENK